MDFAELELQPMSQRQTISKAYIVINKTRRFKTAIKLGSISKPIFLRHTKNFVKPRTLPSKNRNFNVIMQILNDKWLKECRQP